MEYTHQQIDLCYAQPIFLENVWESPVVEIFTELPVSAASSVHFLTVSDIAKIGL